MQKVLKLGIVLLCIYGNVSGQDNLSQEDITVLQTPADTMMRSYLTKIVDRQFAVRDSLLSTLKTAEDWDMRSQAIRDSIIAWTGPLPERTPLNVRITGRIERDDYIIEKILFESRPDYLVSANLYLPKNNSELRPALLNVIGHTPYGKADERYQRLSIAQVKNNFVVLTIDGLGQGERGGGSSSFHQPIGTQAFISGTHLFNYMVWDAIRAIDYLVSRPEVDPDKISMTGSSGGGMLTTYILPFENRITVAVPTTNPNTWSYRVHADLATDHEQVFFGAFASSIDPRGDPLFTHVPKPLLLNTTTDDNLNPPRGVWDLSTWLYKSYSAHGAPEKFTTTMVKAGHDYNQEQREITYAWMLRWTGNDSSDFWEHDTPIEKEEDLWAATGGNIFNEPDSRRNQELVLDYLRENKAEWGEVKTRNELRSHKSKVSALMESVLYIDADNIMVSGDFEKSRKIGDVIVRSFIIRPEEGIVLPGIFLESQEKSSKQEVILYIDGEGKSNLLKDMDIVKDILNEGYSVCAVDLRGIGETAPDMANKFWDFLAGKPIFGQRVHDVLTTIKWLKESSVKAQNITLWGLGMGALYGAFAGVLSDDVSGLLLEESLISFESVVQVKEPEYGHEVILPNILEKFDTPQVYQALSPRPVKLLDPKLGDKTSAGNTVIKEIYEPVSTTYKAINRERAWHALNAKGGERGKMILDFLKNDF